MPLWYSVLFSLLVTSNTLSSAFASPLAQSADTSVNASSKKVAASNSALSLSNVTDLDPGLLTSNSTSTLNVTATIWKWTSFVEARVADSVGKTVSDARGWSDPVRVGELVYFNTEGSPFIPYGYDVNGLLPHYLCFQAFVRGVLSEDAICGFFHVWHKTPLLYWTKLPELEYPLSTHQPLKQQYATYDLSRATARLRGLNIDGPLIDARISGLDDKDYPDRVYWEIRAMEYDRGTPVGPKTWRVFTDNGDVHDLPAATQARANSTTTGSIATS